MKRKITCRFFAIWLVLLPQTFLHGNNYWDDNKYNSPELYLSENEPETNPDVFDPTFSEYGTGILTIIPGINDNGEGEMSESIQGLKGVSILDGYPFLLCLLTGYAGFIYLKKRIYRPSTNLKQ